MISMYDFVDMRSSGSPLNNGANPTLGFYGADLLPSELMFAKCAGDVLRKRPHASEYYARVEAMTDWHYGALARWVACGTARSPDGRAACARDMAEQPVVDNAAAVNTSVLRRLDGGTHGLAGYLSRLFPSASVAEGAVPVFMPSV